MTDDERDQTPSPWSGVPSVTIRVVIGPDVPDHLLVAARDQLQRDIESAARELTDVEEELARRGVDQ